MQLKLHATIVARTLFRGWRLPIIRKLIWRAIKRISPSPPQFLTNAKSIRFYFISITERFMQLSLHATIVARTLVSRLTL
ncbi:MAG: hypothetical protein J6U74_04520, partial [Clostridia bacterium]|nr:hypothetical protein [Clostridia bacterium]